MPIYTFECKGCSGANEEQTIFELSMGMNDDRSTVKCPQCENTEHVVRVFNTFSIANGLTAVEKSAGTTKHRADLGKFMRDQRTKRKREYAPGTVQRDSNELWAGNTLPEGIKAPLNKR